MFYINYDVARQIIEDRRAEAMARAARRRAARVRKVAPRHEKHAEVIELEFGAHCDTEQIGA